MSIQSRFETQIFITVCFIIHLYQISKLSIFKIGACPLFYNQPHTKHFQDIPQTLLNNRYELVAFMLPDLTFILYLTKDSKTRKVHCRFLENWVRLFIPAQLFLSLNNTKKKIYANVPEVLNFNPKISIRKYPIFLQLV